MANTYETIKELVDKVERNQIRLPEMQRGYVWKSTQVRDLIDSLYRGYPAGNILMWETSDDDMPATRDFAVSQSNVKHSSYLLLLDGQQRITSLSRLLRGKMVEVKGTGGKLNEIDILFNINHPDSLTNLDVDSDDNDNNDSDDQDLDSDESTDVLSRIKDLTFVVANNSLKGEKSWVSVKDIFNSSDNTDFLKRAGVTSFDDPNYNKFNDRLNQVKNIKNYEFHLITLDRNMSYEEVTEIFVRVNSLGTKLRGSDLALAQITAKWPGSLELFEKFQSDCEKNGWNISIGTIVRALIATITNQAKFRVVSSITKANLESGWKETQRAINFALSYLKNNIGIEGTSLLTSPYFIITLAGMARFKEYDISTADSNKLIKWFVIANSKGRYSAGSSEGMLNQDLRCKTPDELLQYLQSQFGKLEIDASDIVGKSINSGFFRTMFIAMRHFGAKDWNTNLVISSKNNDNRDKIEYHHIIPRDLLDKFLTDDKSAKKEKINDMANFTFIGKITNIKISNNEPVMYLDEIIKKYGAEILKPHCIPLDRSLWELSNYDEFLKTRRNMIAESINNFIIDKTTQE